MSRFIDWTASAKARALLADCAANPPERRRMLASLPSIYAGGPEWTWAYDRNDERVDALGALQNAAFARLERSGRVHLHMLLSGIDDAIDAARAATPKPRSQSRPRRAA